jgi:antitoxin VapB
MPLHIKDEGASAAVRRLARVRKLSLTEAVRTACEEALARDDRARTVVERLADIHERVRRAARTGKKADKPFFNREWGDDA